MEEESRYWILISGVGSAGRSHARGGDWEKRLDLSKRPAWIGFWGTLNVMPLLPPAREDILSLILSPAMPGILALKLPSPPTTPFAGGRLGLMLLFSIVNSAVDAGPTRTVPLGPETTTRPFSSWGLTTISCSATAKSLSLADAGPGTQEARKAIMQMRYMMFIFC